MKQFAKHNTKTILWTFIVVGVCVVPGNEIPSPPIINIPHLDKIVHAGLYFILTLFSVKSFSRQNLVHILKQKPFQSAFIYAVVLGVLVELVQYNYIPNRSGDVLDALANSTGSLFAVFILKKWKLSFIR